MSTKPSPSELPADEELVAYLDGELPPDDCRLVEERLASDETYRQQLRDLDQAWDALDVLPQPTVGDEFARTTIEMVSVAAQRDLSQETAAATETRRKRTIGYATAAVAAAVVGFVVGWSLLPDANEPLLADLPVITQVDRLAPIDDVDFLRQLSARVSPERMAENDEALEQEVRRLQHVRALDVEQRREWVSALSPDDKAVLQSNMNRFTRTDQERLRNLEAQIAADDDAEQLQRAMLAYRQWLDRRPTGDRNEISQMPVEERLARIEQIVHDEDRRAARQLSEADAQALKAEVLAIVQERRAALVEEMQRQGRDDAEEWLQDRQAATALFILGRELFNDRTADEVRQRLVARLSPQAQEHLENSGQSGRNSRGWRRSNQLWRWVRDSLQPRRGPQELERFFAEELTDNERERLLSLSANEMETELERIHAARQIGFNGPLWQGFGGPPRFDGERPGSPDSPRGSAGRREGPPRGGPDGFGPDGLRPDGRGADRFDREGRFDRNRPDRGPGGRGGPGPDGRDGPRDDRDRRGDGRRPGDMPPPPVEAPAGDGTSADTEVTPPEPVAPEPATEETPTEASTDEPATIEGSEGSTESSTALPGPDEPTGP